MTKSNCLYACEGFCFKMAAFCEKDKPATDKTSKGKLFLASLKFALLYDDVAMYSVRKYVYSNCHGDGCCYGNMCFE